MPVSKIVKKAARRPGPDRGAKARRPRKLDPNFAQSRDLREDRGERQTKLVHAPQTLRPRFGCK